MGLGGRQVGVRTDDGTLSFFDPSSRELLRVRPNPLPRGEVRRVRGGGACVRPDRHQVRALSLCGCSGGSAVGTVVVCRQVVSPGAYAGHTVTVRMTDTRITVDLDGQIRVIRRTTDVRSVT